MYERLKIWGKQGAGQPWSCTLDGWRIWRTGMPPSSDVQARKWGCYLLPRKSCLCRIVKGTFLSKKTQFGCFWSSWGQGSVFCTCMQGVICSWSLPKGIGRCLQISWRWKRSESFQILYFSVNATCNEQEIDEERQRNLGIISFLTESKTVLRMQLQFAYIRSLCYCPALSQNVFTSGTVQLLSFCGESMDSYSDSSHD